MQSETLRLAISFIAGALIGSLLSFLIPFILISRLNPWFDFVLRQRHRTLIPSLRAARQLEQLIKVLGNVDTWLSSDETEYVKQVRSNLWKQLKYLEIIALFYRIRFSRSVSKQCDYLRNLFFKGEEAYKAIDIISKNPQLHEETRKVAKQYLIVYRNEKRSKAITHQKSTTRARRSTQQASPTTKPKRSIYSSRKKKDQSGNTMVFYRGKQTIHMENNPMKESGDTYNVDQAGAVGPDAHAHDMSFQQVKHTQKSNLDLLQLARELHVLRQALKEDATDPEHDAQIGAIALAEIEAQKGDENKSIEYLKQAGKWSFETATKIGVTVAAAAINKALGLS